VIEHEFPLIARLTLCALGAVEGGRIRRPLDPVAAWFLRNRPALLPEEASLAALTTVRARTTLVDRLLESELARARKRGDSLCLWGIGGAFDGRWSRMAEAMRDVVVEIREVEDPLILEFKDRVLEKSPFAEAWHQVQTRPKSIEGWTVRPRSGARPLVVMEGLAGRMSPSALRRLLQRILYEVPAARVILGLPGRPRQDGDQWTSFRIRSLGFAVEEDTNLGPRGRLLTPDGAEMCPGMYPLRVLLLTGREPGTPPPGPVRR